MTKNIRRLLLTVFLIFLAQSLTSVLMPIEATGIGMSASAVGLLVGIPQGVGFITDIPVASWSDIVGRRLPIIAGSVAGLLAAVLFTSAGSAGLLGVAVLVFGISMSLSSGPTLAFVTEAAEPRDHARIQGFNGSVQGLSILVGATSAGLLLSAAGARAAFWTMALVMALIGLISYGLRERTRKGIGLHLRPRSLATRYLRVLELIRTERAVRMAGASSLLYTLQLLTLENSFIPLYLIGFRHYAGAVVGLLLATRSLVGVGLSAMYGRIFARFGLVRPILIGNLIGFVGIIMVGLIANPLALVLPFALQGAGIAFGPATANLLITSATAEEERAIGFSANSFMGRVGGFAFPIIVGFAIATGGYKWLFITAGALGAAGLVALSVAANSLGIWQQRARAVANI